MLYCFGVDTNIVLFIVIALGESEQNNNNNNPVPSAFVCAK